MSVSSISFDDSEDFETFSETLDSPSKMPVLVTNTNSAEKGSQTSVPVRDPPPAAAPKRKHARFYFEDANVTFLVGDVLYRVPKHFFRRDSSYFRTLFNENPGKGTDSAAPIPLDGVECGEFDALLSILYPAHFHECELKTVEAWTSVLRLSTEWSFPSIRTLAIDRLLPIASPVDKVVLGRTYDLDAWLRPGFEALCDRAQSPTVDEAIRLGFRDTILITTIREIRSRNYEVTFDRAFNLAGGSVKVEENEAEARKKIDDEVATGKKAYEEAVKRKKVFEEAAAKKRADEEAAAKQKALAEAKVKKQAEEAAEAKKRADERCERMAEEAAARKKADEEAAARKEAEKQAALKKWEDEYRRKVEEEAIARKKAVEDAEARKKVDEEAAVKKWEEEYDRKMAEEATAKEKGAVAKKPAWGWMAPLPMKTDAQQDPGQLQTQPTLLNTHTTIHSTNDGTPAAVSQFPISEARGDKLGGEGEEVTGIDIRIDLHVDVVDSGGPGGADDCVGEMGDIGKMSASQKKKLRKKAAKTKKAGEC
ncbi:hypothetical protein EVG20_g4115 [Dentipellis fragilis]|uniref:BTB domain-containing protein n=1 Tax=Dentipellis fragilis TaxID=205917 RepID=A0A4Y9YX97_9AGAM|nr:hypothetical protein EVG20_g4115 [Dentipellis fragilis]